MDPSVFGILADVDKKNFNLILGPAQNAGEEHQTDSLHTLEKVLVAPGAAKLVVGILGPSVYGPLEATLDNVDKAGVGELVLVSGRGVQWAVELLGCLHQELVPLADRGVSGQGVVV